MATLESVFVTNLYNNVLFRDPTTEELNSAVADLTLNGVTRDQLRTTVITSTEYTSNVAAVVRLYEGVLGRAPDTDGINFWADYLTDQTAGLEMGSEAYTNARVAVLEQISDLFASSQEAADRGLAVSGVTSDSDSAAITAAIESLYTTVLGRASEAAGLSYWTDVISSGAATIGQAIQYFTESTENVTQEIGFTTGYAALRAYDNQGPSTAQLNQFANDASTTEVLAAAEGVGTSTTELPTGAGTVDNGEGSGGGQVGSTFTLTDQVDVLQGTANNDTFVGDAATITTADQVDGAGGTDTIQIYDLAAQTDVPTLTGVEIIELYNANAPAGFDLTGVTDLTTLVLDNPTNADTFDIGGSVAVTLRGMADGEAVTVTGPATDTTHDLTVTNMGTIAGAGVTVNANGAAVTTVNLAASGTVAAGTDSDIVLASTGTETTVNVTGSGDLALTTAASVVTLGASAFTGNLTYVSGATTSATSITTGSGNDTVTATAAVNYTIDLGEGDDTLTTADAAGELTVSDSIAGGAGTDTLAIASAEAAGLDDGDAADTAVLAKITGFEQLRITDALNAGTLAIDNLGFNYLSLAADLTGDETVNGFTSGATIEMRNAADETDALIVGMTGATGAGTNSDTINLLLNADLTVNDTSYTKSFDLAGINIVNINATDRVAASVADTNDNGQEGYVVDLADGTAGNSANIQTVNITGEAQVSYTVNAATTALETVDASASTGNIIVNAAAFAGTQGVSVTTNTGVDTLTGSNLADILSSGAAADTLTGGQGADVLTGGAGADTFEFDETGDFAAATAATLVAAADEITDFESALDILSLNAANWSIAQNGTAAVGVAAINAEGFATFVSADDTLAERITAVEAAINAGGVAAAGQFALFEFSGDSYAFISEGTDGVGAGDMLVKLTGVTGLSDTTISTVDLTIS